MKFLPRFFLAAVLGLLAAFASPALAHTTSVTHIDVTVDGSTLTVSLNLHQADLLEHALGNSGAARFADRAEFEDTSPRVLAYVLEHLIVTADGESVPLLPQGWPGQRVELRHMDSNGMDVASEIPMTLRGELPRGAHRIEMKPTLYSGTNFAAIFDVSVYPSPAAKPVNILADKQQPIEFRLTPAPADLAASSVNPVEAAQASTGVFATIAWFLTMGFYHIIPYGLDHILFVLGLYFLSPKLKDLFWQVTAFTVAHSITLALAAFNIFTLPGHIVEPLIALSIVAVAVENIMSRGKPVRPWRWALVFGFGLIHGMGFADVLHGTHLPTDHVLAAILSFNVGVEGGQIAVLMAAMLLTRWWAKREWYFPYVAAPASAVIACVGAVWAVQRIMGG